MNGSKVWVVFCCLAVLLAMTLEAQAASARARCRVRNERVRVQIDGRDLTPGVYTARVTNVRTGETATTEDGKEAEATAQLPDVDLDFDSTADANDMDSFIASDFARRGHLLLVEVMDDEQSTIASATARCRR